MNLRVLSPLSSRRPIVSALLALAVLVGGFKLLGLFLYYSFAVGGLHGMTTHKDFYEEAKTRQMVFLAAFLASQVLGGALLRATIGAVKRQPVQGLSFARRLKSLAAYTAGFGLITGVCVKVFLATRR